MLEVITASCRALACEARLVVLYHLSVVPELQASKLAGRAHTPADHVSQHLRRLVAADLLRCRRSGRYVYYRLHIPSSRPSRLALGRLVRHAFADTEWATQRWDEQGIIHLSPRAASVLPKEVLRAADVVFDAATAFSHPRRLQILRVLADGKSHPIGTLGRSLHMSPLACSRHLDKLRRRGYITEPTPGLLALSSTHRSACHQALLRDVRRHWGTPSHS